MEPLKTLHARLAVFPQADIDTDQIIPARFLTTTERSGLGRHCFADWRFDADGNERPDFPLNAPARRGAGVLLAGHNFGCGSSREHAPWALLDYGIRVVISTGIADIFKGNALKNGLLPIVVSEADWQRLADRDGAGISVDLQSLRIDPGVGEPIPFEVEAFARRCLLDGVDQLGYLLAQEPEIAAFEASRAA
ncbi:MAG: 3-isopropylmalate dehydratase small subunit [Xanthomonadaceae bacterium]|nr:3-isopropylmalate dehydratase small subunit [Xanthomonadaceae bacterium]